MKTKQEQIAEMAVIGCVRNPQAHTTEECLKCEFSDGCCNAYRHAEALYNAGYRKTFTGELASDTQKAFKEGYSKGVDYGIEFGKVLLYKTRKETAKEYHNKFAEVIRERDYVEGYAEIGMNEENDEILKSFGVEVSE